MHEGLGFTVALAFLCAHQRALCNNFIRTESHGLQANVKLEEVQLGGNPIGDGGCRHLLGALQANRSLQCLGLQGVQNAGAHSNQSGAQRNMR